MSKKIKALVLSGGGAYGSYQVGVLKALAEKNLVGWDVIAGVSVGAINTLWLSSFNKEEILEAIKSLEILWGTLIQGNKSIYKPWFFKPFNYVASLWKGSLYNTKPLLNLLKENTNIENLNKSNVDAFVGTVSLNTGNFLLKEIKNEPNTILWTLASATMPMLFNPVFLENEKWVDGGVKSVTPVKELLAIYGNNIEHIDIILANPLIQKQDAKKYLSIIEVATKSLDSAIHEIMNTDIDLDCFSGSSSVYMPSESLPFDAFDFDPRNLKKAIELGYLETLSKLNNI
jgi:NTE family protein